MLFKGRRTVRLDERLFLAYGDKVKKKKIIKADLIKFIVDINLYLIQ